MQNYTQQHLKLASDRMKTRYDRLVNSAGCNKGDNVAVSSNSDEVKIAQAPVLMGGRVQGSHPDE
jgi:hypothetical protein